MKDSDIVIASAVRTPIGILSGGLSSLQSYELGAIVIGEALKRCNLDPKSVELVIMGQVVTALSGMNPARQASIRAGVPDTVPAYTINTVCGSGMHSIIQGVNSIKAGDCKIAVCGGQESMSNAPHAIKMRTVSKKLGDTSLVDTLLFDGLTDAMNNISMGSTAENLAVKYNISRRDQEIFAVNSHQKASKANSEGLFDDEIIPITVTSGKTNVLITHDEGIRPTTSLESLARLKPCFDFTEKGTVTAGTSSSINDGASAVVLMTFAEAKSRNIVPFGRIVASTLIGGDPLYMGILPVDAVRAVIKKAQWDIDSVDIFELNEAFAVQAVACINELGIDSNKVNIWGGSVALGHPLGCSGARILTTLVHAMKKENKKRGIASLCIGGGMSVALCIDQC